MKWVIEVKNEGHTFYTETYKDSYVAEQRARKLKEELQKIMADATITVEIRGIEVDKR